ncbi:hypothetical protein [Streptomyces shenzhenensis]|uniref:hypothetical protein n=1 Tax=Streptomyces shenzhenensis TaxID=943815 RepID=UPI0033D7205F
MLEIGVGVIGIAGTMLGVWFGAWLTHWQQRADATVAEHEQRLAQTQQLRDPGPVSVTPLDPLRPAMRAGNSYVIWSAAARHVQQVLDAGDGPEEVVFAPGTLFRVLEVREGDGGGAPVQIFLRELTGPLGPQTDPAADRAALERLVQAVSQRSGPAPAGQWPERRTGPFGAGP